MSLVNSKGLTKRDVKVGWTLASMIPSDFSTLSNIQSTLDSSYSDLLYFRIDKSTIESLSGKTLNFRSRVTNFLGNYADNYTQIVFSSSKKLEIKDLPDSLTLQRSIANTLYPRFRIPYCSGDNQNNIESDMSFVTYTC